MLSIAICVGSIDPHLSEVRKDGCEPILFQPSSLTLPVKGWKVALAPATVRRQKGPVTSHIHQARDDLLLTRQTPSKGDNNIMIDKMIVVSDFSSDCWCDSLLIAGLV